MHMYVYDIECLQNYFLVCFLEVKSGLRSSFEISDFKDDSKELLLFLKSKINLIGYNCLSYDSQLLEFILKRNGRVTPKDLYNESQRIIDNEFPDIPEWKLSIPHLDLLKIWHYDNKAKRTSLKWIQFSIDWHNVEDIPFEHYHVIKEEEREMIESYCWNDVESTLEFYKITIGQTKLPLYKGKDKLDLRFNINKEFNVNSFNWNDVKIGDAINKSVYLKESNQKSIEKKGTIRPKLTIEECVSDTIEFKTQFLKDFLVKLKRVTFDPTNVKEHPGWKFFLGDMRISFGFGGIHSIDAPRKFISDENYYIIDRDVAFVKTLAQLKFLKLTGTSLESYLLSLGSNALNGVANHNCIVKKIRIGQSAAKIPNWNKVQRLNRE